MTFSGLTPHHQGLTLCLQPSHHGLVVRFLGQIFAVVSRIKESVVQISRSSQSTRKSLPTCQNYLLPDHPA